MSKRSQKEESARKKNTPSISIKILSLVDSISGFLLGYWIVNKYINKEESNSSSGNVSKEAREYVNKANIKLSVSPLDLSSSPSSSFQQHLHLV